MAAFEKLIVTVIGLRRQLTAQHEISCYGNRELGMTPKSIITDTKVSLTEIYAKADRCCSAWSGFTHPAMSTVLLHASYVVVQAALLIYIATT